MGYQTLIDLVPNSSEALVLDAGCGSGNYAVKLCKSFKKIVAFEVNAGMLDKLKAKIEAEKIDNIEMIQGSLIEEFVDLEPYKG